MGEYREPHKVKERHKHIPSCDVGNSRMQCMPLVFAASFIGLFPPQMLLFETFLVDKSLLLEQ